MITFSDNVISKRKKNFMAPFYGWGSTASRLVPLQGDSLLFTTEFPDIPGTLLTAFSVVILVSLTLRVHTAV